MFSSACSTTLDPTLVGSAPFALGGAGGASDRGDGGASESGSAGEPSVTTLSLTDCTQSTFGGHVYSACNRLRTYGEAIADCASGGAVLVKVESAEETAMLKGLMLPGKTWAWIGASRDADFNWSWLDGTPFWHGGVDGVPEPGAYTNWHDGEPDNTSLTVRGDEECASIDVPSGTWYDRNCNLILPYFCELTPPGLATGSQ